MWGRGGGRGLEIGALSSQVVTSYRLPIATTGLSLTIFAVLQLVADRWSDGIGLTRGGTMHWPSKMKQTSNFQTASVVSFMSCTVPVIICYKDTEKHTSTYNNRYQIYVAIFVVTKYIEQQHSNAVKERSDSNENIEFCSWTVVAKEVTVDWCVGRVTQLHFEC